MDAVTREEFLAFRREVRRKLKHIQEQTGAAAEEEQKCTVCGSEDIYVKKKFLCRKHYFQEYRQKNTAVSTVRTCVTPLCTNTFKSRKDRLCIRCDRKKRFGSK